MNTVQITDKTFGVPALTRRSVAYLIDSVGLLLLVVVYALVGLLDSRVGTVLASVLLLPIMLYYPLLLALTGTTVGKGLLGMHVIRVPDAAKPGFGASLGRCMLFHLVPFGMVIALVVALRDKANRGFHDKGAGTIVVMREDSLVS